MSTTQRLAVTVRMSPELHEALVDYAAERRWSLGATVVAMVEDALTAPATLTPTPTATRQ